MPNSSPSSRRQHEQHTGGGGYHPQQAAAHPSAAGGTIYGVSIAQAQQQQLHPPGVPPPPPETYTTQQYPPAAGGGGSAGYGAGAALPLSGGYHGMAHYHHANAGYPPPLPYSYALPTPPHQGGYTATAAGAHFYPPPPPPTLSQVGGGGPLPNPYVVAAASGYPYPMYASSTTTVHSPTSQTMGDNNNNKVVSSVSENNMIAYDQYSNKSSASPLKHDDAAMATRPSSLTNNKGNVDGVKQGSDKSPQNATSNRSDFSSSSSSRLGTKPMHLHVDTQIDTTGAAAVTAAEVQHGNNVDDMISRVKPMKSDFHFYAEDHKKDVMHTIESEWKESDPVELISELNERLLKRWEDETDKVRNLYVAKEEADRTRFMNEEEIESRHCATLTSRPRHQSSDREFKSTPKNKDGGGGGGGDDDGDQQGNHQHRENDDQDRSADDEEGEEQEEYESPTKKLKEDDEKGSDQKS